MSRDDIASFWLRGTIQQMRYMRVFRDDWDKTYYPMFSKDAAEYHAQAKKIEDDRQRAIRYDSDYDTLMEVYDLKMDYTEQMDEERAMHPPPPIRRSPRLATK